MFERYGFAGAYIQIQAVLTLYAQGEAAGTGHYCCIEVGISSGLLAHQETQAGASKDLQVRLSETLSCNALLNCTQHGSLSTPLTGVGGPVPLTAH